MPLEEALAWDKSQLEVEKLKLHLPMRGLDMKPDVLTNQDLEFIVHKVAQTGDEA